MYGKGWSALVGGALLLSNHDDDNVVDGDDNDGDDDGGDAMYGVWQRWSALVGEVLVIMIMIMTMIIPMMMMLIDNDDGLYAPCRSALVREALRTR